MRLPGTLAAGPFIESARRDDAPPIFEGAAEHRLLGDSLGARVECRRCVSPAFLPPGWYQAPAHRHHFATHDFAVPYAGGDDVNEVSGGDIIARLQVTRRAGLTEHA